MIIFQSLIIPTQHHQNNRNSKIKLICSKKYDFMWSLLYEDNILIFRKLILFLLMSIYCFELVKKTSQISIYCQTKIKYIKI